MNRPSWNSKRYAGCLAMASVVFLGLSGLEQSHGQTLGLPTSLGAIGGRKLAADALEIIAPAADPGETSMGPIDLAFVKDHPELVWKAPQFPQGHPHFAPSSNTLLEMSKNIVFRHEIWCMEFAFKPVRMIEIDGVSPSGESQKKIVWYLLYRLRYLGGDLRPVPEKDKFGNEIVVAPKVETDQWRRVLPTFVLNARVINKQYLDRIIPAAKAVIAANERVGKPIHDSVEIQRVAIQRSTDQKSHEVWGVATWTDVDPRTNFFSIDIRGLTNAQRIAKAADGSPKFLQKTLVLHFSRPGDTVNEIADTIRYGIPAIDDPSRQEYVLQQYGVDQRLDHIWAFR